VSKRKVYVRDGRSPIPASEAVSRVMSSNKGKDTSPELILRKGMWAKGIRGYRKHPKCIPGRPDVVFPKQHLAIMVNGCFWHRCPVCSQSIPKVNSQFWKAKFDRNIERDIRVLEELNTLGWRTLVIWECSIKKNLDDIIKMIQDELRK
jgi:DNA mismatch endonuclease (patch repair protein)